MAAADRGDWTAALFLLDHGVTPDHRAPDGTSLHTILAGRDSADDAAWVRFAEALRARQAAGR